MFHLFLLQVCQELHGSGLAGLGSGGEDSALCVFLFQRMLRASDEGITVLMVKADI